MSLNWGSLADWVSGLGSLAAVVTALYLSKNAQRIKLTGYCGIRLIVGTGGPMQELFYVSITNVGRRTAVINNIGLRVGLFKKRYAIITVVKDKYSDGVPISLADGQVANWSIPLDVDKKWINELVSDGCVASQSDAKSLRVTVHTTHGAVKIIKPEPKLVEEIIRAVKLKHK